MEKKGIEFMIDGINVIIKQGDELHVMSETADRDLITSIRDRIATDYPDAYHQLLNWYKKASLNKPYFDFLLVRRFIKCNFMRSDKTLMDIDEEGNFNTEEPICPIAGECEGYGIVCFCKMTSVLTEEERKVLNMYTQGMSNETIAEELYLSPHTIHNTVVRAYRKIKVKNKAAALLYIQKHK